MPPTWGAAVYRSRNKENQPRAQGNISQCLTSALSSDGTGVARAPQMQGHKAILDIRCGHTELCTDHGKHSLWARAKRYRCVTRIR